jgi:hypothetical protein
LAGTAFLSDFVMERKPTSAKQKIPTGSTGGADTDSFAGRLIGYDATGCRAYNEARMPRQGASASYRRNTCDRVMRRLDFKEASETVRAVDEELEALLRVVWDQAARERQRDLSFYLANYPYKNFVFKNGRALDPDGNPLPSGLLVGNLLPVGLILDNVLEVIDEVIRREEVIEFPQSLLFKRQLIGTWEFLDQQLQVEARPLLNWTVSSGSRSLRFLEFPTQRVEWDRLRARYRHLSTYDKGTVRDLREIDLIEMISEVDQKSKQWVTPILYFSSDWFKELERQLADPECRTPAMELASYFKDTSWASLARVRYNDDQLTDALTELGGDSNAARCKAAYLLLRHSLQVLSKRRPCFALAKNHADLGPLDAIRKDLLQVARLDENILVPGYLQAGESGFLSLSQLVPSAFDQSPEDSLEDVFKIIQRARNAAMKHRIAVPGLDNLPDLFSRLTFRVKSGRLRQKGPHGSILTFRINWLSHDSGGFQRVNIPIEEFYAPFFSHDNLPTSDSRFFRVAVKLDLRELPDATVTRTPHTH